MSGTKIESLFSKLQEEKIIYPDTQSNIQKLQDKIHTLKDRSFLIGLKSGYFDGGIHPNHKWDLRNLRMELVKRDCERRNIIFETLTDEKQRDQFTLARVALIVLIPGNEHTSLKKGFQTDKGSFPRPILDWSRRAEEVSEVVLPLDSQSFIPVVDIVTAYDSVIFKGTQFESYLGVGEMIHPDVWFVSGDNNIGEKYDRFNTIRPYSKEVVIIPPVDYRSNPFTGRPYNTTDTYRTVIKGYLQNQG